MSVYGYDPEAGAPRTRPAPDDDETLTALRQAETAARYARLDEKELPWLGDIDRRADDDVEFCVEGED